MSEERRRILDLLAQGKITTDEAEQLLNAVATPTSTAVASAPRLIKYLRVLVDARGGDDDEKAKVNIRVPIALLRAGMKFASFIPQETRSKVDDALREKGIAFSLNDINPETIDDLVESLGELTVDVDTDDATMNIFSE